MDSFIKSWYEQTYKGIWSDDVLMELRVMDAWRDSLRAERDKEALMNKDRADRAAMRAQFDLAYGVSNQSER